MGKKKTTPKPNQNKKPEDKPNNTQLKYQNGNGEFLIIQLLTLVCNKLDEMRNHTRVLVEQNEELLKRLDQEDKDVEDI
jgi:hypothetical protein